MVDPGMAGAKTVLAQLADLRLGRPFPPAELVGDLEADDTITGITAESWGLAGLRAGLAARFLGKRSSRGTRACTRRAAELKITIDGPSPSNVRFAGYAPC